MKRLPEEVRKAAVRGWRLFPVKAGNKKPPLLKNWPDKATCDPDQLEAWATQFPDCNWGMATGPASGIFALDIDGEPGIAALSAYHRQGHLVPDTFTVSTGRGSQLYFCWPEAQNVLNSAGKLGKGLDVRGDHGYVVIPPSIHPSGIQYAYKDPNKPIVDAPDWLLELLTQDKAAPSAPRGHEIGVLIEGQRNDGLARFGGALRRRGASRQELEAALLHANAQRCRPSLPDDEVLRIAASMATYPVGGPDPLECAWATVQEESHPNRYHQFLALARKLQLARPGLSIALPLERIGTLMECDWTQARRWRHRAEREGRLRQTERYVPHRRAALYVFTECLESSVPLGLCGPLQRPTSGLVGHAPKRAPSGTV